MLELRYESGAPLYFEGHLDHVGDNGTSVLRTFSEMFWNDASDSRLKADPYSSGHVFIFHNGIACYAKGLCIDEC